MKIKPDRINDQYVSFDINEYSNTLKFKNIKSYYYSLYRFPVIELDTIVISKIKNLCISDLSFKLLNNESIDKNILVVLLDSPEQIQTIWKKYINLKQRIYILQDYCYKHLEHNIIKLLQLKKLDINLIKKLIWFNPQCSFALGILYYKKLSIPEKRLIHRNIYDKPAYIELYFSLMVKNLPKKLIKFFIKKTILLSPNILTKNYLLLKKSFQEFTLTYLPSSQYVHECFHLFYLLQTNNINFNKSIIKKFCKINGFFTYIIDHYLNFKSLNDYDNIIFPYLIKQFKKMNKFDFTYFKKAKDLMWKYPQYIDEMNALQLLKELQ